MNELRNKIWDYLYRQGKPQLIGILAEQMNVSPGEIRQTVDDPWFEIHDECVAIARTG